MASERQLIPRVLAFLVLVTGINFWLDHHLGVRLASSSAVSMGAAAVAGALALLDKLGLKSEQENLMTRAAGLARIVFWPPLLVVAWVIAVVLGLTLSSVTVVPEAEGAKFTAVLTPGAVPRTDPKDTPGAQVEKSEGKDSVVFMVPTSPFGRAMRLSVAGYVPVTLDVYPLLGRRVVLGADLRPSPSVLLRLPVSAHEVLGDRTRIVVRRLVGDQKPVAEAEAKVNKSAFLLGPRRAVPTTLRRGWELELEADGLSRSRSETAAQLATMLREWANPIELATAVTLEPGMTLIAELQAPGGLVATGTLSVGSEPFQELALRRPGE